jgi:hypothetical protein
MGNAASSSMRDGLEAIRSAPMPEDEPAFDALVGKVIPSSPVDLSTVIAMLQPEDIRELIAERPRNLARLIVGVRDLAIRARTCARVSRTASSSLPRRPRRS